MNEWPAAVLYSRDPDVSRRLGAFLEELADVRSAASAPQLMEAVEQDAAVVVVADLRSEAPGELAQEVMRRFPACVFVGLAEPRSRPALRAEAAGAFAVLPLDGDDATCQSTLQQAFAFLRLKRENAWLREEAARRPSEAVPSAPPAAGRAAVARPVWHFFRALRSLGQGPACLRELAEGVAASFAASRAGLFVLRGGAYRFAGGIGCLAASERLTFAADDLLARWLQREAHLVSRSTLDLVADPGDRQRLARFLDLLGAEVLVPLLARGHLLGWLFVGRRAGGLPFAYADLEELAGLGDPVGATVENTLLYEEVAAQKTFAETVLQAMPTAVVTTDAQGLVRWFNQAAATLWGERLAGAVGQPAETVDSRVAGALRAALAGAPPGDHAAWRDELSGRVLSLRVHRLGREGDAFGAVALIEDETEARASAQREGQAHRAAFWQDLAAGMSHEVRNPLVAIKTFAQLLPERYKDAEFRGEFQRLVTEEVGRLTAMVEQLAAFASPPAPASVRYAPGRVLERVAAECAKSFEGTPLDVAVAAGLPEVVGDERTLAEAVRHLLVNALEAVADRDGGRVRLAAEPMETADGRAWVTVAVRDNGPGVPPGLRDKVFSPFCTSKAQGMGFGLPVARRAALDHGGDLQLVTGETGTVLLLRLPAAPEGRSP